ncbi:MAG: DnaA/Hda family protein, partial [Treponema sp.]|nr:DnaA/Hda family protein [Treponema sp.]
MTEWNYEVFWTEAMSQLRTEVGEQEFSIWFSNLEYIKGEENGVFIRVPSSFYRDQVKNRYQSRITGKLAALIGKELNLNYEVGPVKKAEIDLDADGEAGIENSGTEQNNQIPPESGSAQKIIEGKKPKEKHPQLQEDYTFDKYIISEWNSFAANAAIAISKNPGKSYNPFFIYGKVGLGKTHLMQAIGNSVYENSDNKVICITSEDFLNEYMDGIRLGKMNLFKNKFRYTDILLIDDIHFFQGKMGVQEELFHTFNALIGAKKQMVFTCDRPPSELKEFSERLMNRFEMSLTVDLQAPLYEGRCAILKQTAEERNIAIPDEVIDLIAKNIS